MGQVHVTVKAPDGTALASARIQNFNGRATVPVSVARRVASLSIDADCTVSLADPLGISSEDGEEAFKIAVKVFAAASGGGDGD